MLSPAVTTPIPFETWLELNPEIAAENKTLEVLIVCDECNGVGEITCPRCGDGMIECPECRGKRQYKIETSEAKKIYEDELAKERLLLERYQACGTLSPIDGGKEYVS